MKHQILHGGHIAEFVKERHAKDVRRLKQQYSVTPKLVILRSHEDPISDIYLRAKSGYGSDIGCLVEVETIPEKEMTRRLIELSEETASHGVLVQLPLKQQELTEEILMSLPAAKDVDGLLESSGFMATTATAIQWLLAGYDVSLEGKNLLIVGNGRLVGAPLAHLWRSSGLLPEIVDGPDRQLEQKVSSADIIVSATGVAGLIKSDWLSLGSVVVDAGTSSSTSGQQFGDVELEALSREDISITPRRGGVGPLTIAVLFQNLLAATEAATLRTS